MSEDHFRPLHEHRRYPLDEMRRRVRSFREEMERRRTVRDYADEPVPRDIVEEAIRAAGRAPSGANMQPWHFAVVGDDEVKTRIRQAAEREEQKFYEERATEEWLEALEPLGTGPDKPFLETAPWLIAVFAESYGVTEEGEERKHYYVRESVGIATGMLITALHHAGLVTLTHTPSPMGFLNDVLDRPENERPFLLLVTGYPADDARVPEIDKKPLEEITTFF